tara:strand:+ start:3836 stop:3976 length:141 start_codon:yes stop_codon:yes gene_type:complete
VPEQSKECQSKKDVKKEEDDKSETIPRISNELVQDLWKIHGIKVNV